MDNANANARLRILQVQILLLFCNNLQLLLQVEICIKVVTLDQAIE